MSHVPYVMHDQTRRKIQSIMSEPQREGPLLTHPVWVAASLLVIAINLIAMFPPLA